MVKIFLKLNYWNREINARPICQETKANLHYVDGNINDILDTKKHDDLIKWKLYLANW